MRRGCAKVVCLQEVLACGRIASAFAIHAYQGDTDRKQGAGMACLRHGLSGTLVVLMVLAAKVLWASDPPTKSVAAAEKAEAKPAAQPNADTARKAIEDAQAAYERERRELKRRLTDDPAWQPTHEPTGKIKPSESGIETRIASFCLTADGRVLVCCETARKERSFLGWLFGQKPAADPKSPGAIGVYGRDGKRLDDWPLSVAPEAICLAPDGTVYVAGGGKILHLSSEGKVLDEVDSPVATAFPLPKSGLNPGKELAEAEAKAKRAEIAALEKKIKAVEKELEKLGESPREKATAADLEALQAKAETLMRQYQDYQEQLNDLRMTPEERAEQLRAERQRRLICTGMAVDNDDLYVVCMATKGYSYCVWRMSRGMKDPKKIVDGLRGCCGQMDIQAGDGLWVAHNGRHKVEHYDREGKKIGSFGRTDRASADGFGGCCEPKNLRLLPKEVLAAESGPPTCVKRFDREGKFLGVALIAPWESGCVRVTIAFHSDSNEYLVLNSGANEIQVFSPKKAGKKPAADKK